MDHPDTSISPQAPFVPQSLDEAMNTVELLFDGQAYPQRYALLLDLCAHAASLQRAHQATGGTGLFLEP